MEEWKSLVWLPCHHQRKLHSCEKDVSVTKGKKWPVNAEMLNSESNRTISNFFFNIKKFMTPIILQIISNVELNNVKLTFFFICAHQKNKSKVFSNASEPHQPERWIREQWIWCFLTALIVQKCQGGRGGGASSAPSGCSENRCWLWMIMMFPACGRRNSLFFNFVFVLSCFWRLKYKRCCIWI